MNAMHDARALAVRLDIRPRIVLADERPAPRRRSFRLPPLAVPAAGYWVAMAALTYFFAQLGPHPLDSVEPARAEPRAAPPSFSEPAPAAPEAPSRMAEQTPPSVSSSAPEAPELAEAGAIGGHLGPRPRRSSDEPEPPAARDPARDELTAPKPARAPEAEAPQVALSFPEFTDSSRPKARERAADGPRIDSLFERADERPEPREPSAPASPSQPERGEARPVVSCEAAVARNSEQLDIGGPRGPVDITRDAYASILQNGSYLSGCSIPERTVFEICAAVKEGRAVGVTVVSNPADSRLNACVRGAVSRLKFPSNPRLDVTHTRFDAVRR